MYRKKFYKVYKQFYPHGKPLNFSNLIFNTFDCDHDNKLNFFEFVTALSIVLHGNLEQKLRCAFKIYDSNSDGVIDKKEMKTAIDSIYELIGEDMKQLKRTRLSEKKVDEIFARLDTNKDGYITLEEFIKGYLDDQYLTRLLHGNILFKDLNNTKEIDTTSTSSGLGTSIITDTTNEHDISTEESNIACSLLCSTNKNFETIDYECVSYL